MYIKWVIIHTKCQLTPGWLVGNMVYTVASHNPIHHQLLQNSLVATEELFEICMHRNMATVVFMFLCMQISLHWTTVAMFLRMQISKIPYSSHSIEVLFPAFQVLSYCHCRHHIVIDHTHSKEPISVHLAIKL